jgi:hypothetical protein
MKYALINMHKTSTMSATVSSLNQEVAATAASITSRLSGIHPAYFILQSSPEGAIANRRLTVDKKCDVINVPRAALISVQCRIKI